MVTMYIAWLEATMDYRPDAVYFGAVVIDLTGIIGTGVIISQFINL